MCYFHIITSKFNLIILKYEVQLEFNFSITYFSLKIKLFIIIKILLKMNHLINGFHLL